MGWDLSCLCLALFLSLTFLAFSPLPVTIYLGSSVNDAVALKKSDLGVALSSSSEVAKEAANCVLTHHHHNNNNNNDNDNDNNSNPSPSSSFPSLCECVYDCQQQRRKREEEEQEDEEEEEETSGKCSIM